jgi:hypothetical protein
LSVSLSWVRDTRRCATVRAWTPGYGRGTHWHEGRRQWKAREPITELP